jgi:polyvinyl alcohol dehydrogenase (cytochrome)
MRRTALATALAASAAVCAFPATAGAAQQQAYAAGLTYVTPVVIAGKADTLRFNNLDPIARHDLDSDTPGLFGTDLIGTGQSAVVKGVDKLGPGTYKFHCSIHSWMHGVLQVAAAGTGPGGGPGLPSPGGPPAVDPVTLLPKAPAEPLGPGQWTSYGGDLSNSRAGGSNAPSYNEVPTLGPVWSFKSAKGDFTGTPVVAHGTLVAGAGDGTVYGLDAATGKLRWSRALHAPINGSAAIHGARVFVPLAKVGSPSIAALRLSDGKRLWTTAIDHQKNADMFGSPVAWDVPKAKGRGATPTVFAGTSAEYGEVNDPNVNVRGSVVAVDAATGRVRWKTFAVPPRHDGGAVWSTPAIDTATGRLYVGTGNAYHAPAASTTDAILALDARTGKLLAHRQATAGDVWNATGNPTAGPDYDFGASPNLIVGANGRKLVGAGQKSGTYWAFDRRTLVPAWSVFTARGAPSVGGIVGSTAYDGKRIYGPDTPAGEEWAASRDGKLAWVSSDAGPLQFAAVSAANGVVYTTDMSATLTARESATGAVLAKLPLGAPSWGGVAIAGGSVFAVTGTSGTTGYVVAYRPRG